MRLQQNSTLVSKDDVINGSEGEPTSRHCLIRQGMFSCLIGLGKILLPGDILTGLIVIRWLEYHSQIDKSLRCRICALAKR